MTDGKRGLWICPHGKIGPVKFNTAKWVRPINSYSVWTRYTNTEIAFGNQIEDGDKEWLEAYDYFIIFSTTGHLPPIVTKLRQMFGDTKKICAMTDGYYADLAEIKIPEPKILQTIERSIDMVLGNRPDSSDWVPALVDTPFQWLGFPIDIETIRKIQDAAEPVDANRVNVYHAYKAATFMRAIQRSESQTLRFVSFRNPSNVFSNRRGWKEPDWAEGFGINVEWHGDAEWSDYIKVMASSKIALGMDLIGQLGRFATEMAAFGIPCIGSSTVGRQEQLHPSTTICPGDQDQMEKVVSLYRDLRYDTEFYEECSREARGNAERIYSPRASLVRWAHFQERLWS